MEISARSVICCTPKTQQPMAGVYGAAERKFAVAVVHGASEVAASK